ncbi:MAG: winged helix-turn-helix transcriptional regulator [Deltaproteobacteria bacterium]|nr:winged helix-turn-helix transcriptional regulator [Deltaproteobacteria bacterium]
MGEQQRPTSNFSPNSPGKSGPSDLGDHLGYWLRAVSNHTSLLFQRRVESQGVTVAEWVVLRRLYDVDDVHPSELARLLGLSRGAVSKLIDRLAAKALVGVRADPHDGRAQRLSLSPAGRALVPVLAALADQNDAEVFGALDPTEQAALFTTLQRLVAQLGLGGAPVD